MKNLPVPKGTSLILRPLDEQDAPAMFESLSDQEAMRLTGTHGEFTFDQVLAFCESLQDQHDRVDYAVCLNDNPDESVGEMILNNIDADNRSANFRTSLYDRRHFDQGIGSEAMPLVLSFGFAALQLHRIELEVYAFNARAIHLYEKLGFVHEGVRRDALLWAGEYHDAIVMGLLETEYEARLSGR